MIGRLNHVAIATPDIKAAAKVYRETLGAKVSECVPQPDHGVTTIFVELPNTKIELLEPLGENSPIAKFLQKNPAGGIHHVCYEVDSLDAQLEQSRATGCLVVKNPLPAVAFGGRRIAWVYTRHKLLVEYLER